MMTTAQIRTLRTLRALTASEAVVALPGACVALYNNLHRETYKSFAEAVSMLREDGYVARHHGREVYIWRKGDAAEANVEHTIGRLVAA